MSVHDEHDARDELAGRRELAEVDFGLADFVSEACDGVEAELARDGGFPDVAASVELAHRMDPTRVPASAVEEVAQLAPVVPLAGQRRRRSTRDDVALAAFVAQVRAAVDVDVADGLSARYTRAMAAGAGAPASPASSSQAHAAASTSGAAASRSGVAASSDSSGKRVWALTLAVAAALVLVAGGVLSAVQLMRDPDSGQAKPNEAALDRGVGADGGGEAAIIDGRQRASQPAPVAPAQAEPEAVEPEPEVVEPEPEADGPVAVREAPRTRGKRRAKAERAPEPTLAELDAQARAAWKAGRLDEAQTLMHTIVRRAGKARLAEMAYGDLLSIARQRGDRRAESKLWRAYLGKFPRGHYADDARAGLCRRTEAGAEQRACWKAYLGDFPDGAHASRARRATAPKTEGDPAP